MNRTAIATMASSVGISVYPAREDGSKRPDTHRWYEYTHPDETGAFKRLSADQLVDRYDAGRLGFGIFTGAASGNVEALDFDQPEAFDAFVALAEACGIGDLMARVRAGFEEATPSGGRHLLYRCDTVSGNQKLAQRVDGKTIIETRGNGGYLVTWPSTGPVHPSGEPYRLIAGGFDQIVTITPEEREAFLVLARTFDETPARAAGPRSSAVAVDGERPGDIYNRQATWDEALPGWTRVFTRGQTTYWRRPGKDRGISATTNHTGKDTLIVFSTSTPFEIAPVSYSKFAAYALLNHSADYGAAAKALHATGYRTAQPSVSLGMTAEASGCDEWRRLAEEQRRYIKAVAGVRKNRALKHVRLTIIALAGEAQTAAETGHVDAEGWFPIAVGDVLAEAAGVSRKTAGVHLDRLAEWGVIEKDVWLLDAIDTETGEVYPTKRKRVVIRLTGSGLEFLEQMATFEPPEREPGPHRCCSHAKQTFLNPLRSFDPADHWPDDDPQTSEAPPHTLDTFSTSKEGAIYAMGSKRPAGWGDLPAGTGMSAEMCVRCGALTAGHVLCSGCDPGGWSATEARVRFGARGGLDG